ncbi:amidase [Novosphingobium terrae]|uniref:amidase n=1 Tax=Novosphingobium terrae TaxID=2726189 RepID=UPI00197FDC42|nr:amidase [Novosphingobium terrae]
MIEPLTQGGAQDALSHCLSLILQEDDRWHAMLAINPQAEAEAEAADRAAWENQRLGPLHGVMLAIKDNIDVAGMATTSGCKALAGAVATSDAPVVARLRAAGAIVVGKTNLSEFSFDIRSRSSLGGDVLCPYAPDSTAGGSSGGSAVAVAREFAMAALGTDTGGSIRIPAACNGLVGLRPAHGMLSLEGVAPLAPSTDTIGPITSSVADARLLYEIMGGQIGGDARARRVGVVRQAFGQDERILAACQHGLNRLAEAGIELVDPLALPGVEDLLAGPHIVDAEFGAAFDAYLATHFGPGTAPASLAELVAGGAFLPDHRDTLIARMAVKSDAAAPILARHRELTAMLQAVMAQHGLDALFYPTMRVIPEGLGNPPGGWAAELAARSGWPAISVPVAAPGERPVGGELLVPAGQEASLFALAAMLERR